MDRKVYELQSEICKALAHPVRMEITDLLQKKELCFTEILKQTGGIKSGLSQHLSIMVEKGILRSRKDRRCHYFSLSSKKVAKACGLLKEVLVENLESKKELLKKF